MIADLPQVAVVDVEPQVGRLEGVVELIALVGYAHFRRGPIGRRDYREGALGQGIEVDHGGVRRAA